MFYLIMDLETTGVNVLIDEPVQIAGIVKNERGLTMSTLNAYIKTSVPISEEAADVHKITPEMLEKEGLVPAQICKKYQDLVWEYQPITLLGYNILNFDFPMWQKFMLRYNLGKFKLPPICTIIDVMHLCSVFFKTRKWPKLAVAAENLGITFNSFGLHDALADIELTWEVYEGLRKEMSL